MNTHDDPAGNGALTPEERALAQRLARLGAQGEPSPALDARILAAAHAAAQAPSAEAPAAEWPPRRRRSDWPRRKAARWPTVFGVAASLALAFGIAWQLRPVPPTPGRADAQSMGEDPLATYKPPAPAMSVRVLPPRPLNMPAPPPAEPARSAPRATARRTTPTEADRQQQPQAFSHPPFVDEALPAHGVAAAAPAAEAAAAPAARAAPPMQRAAPAAAKAASNAQNEADTAERRREDADTLDAIALPQSEEPEYAEPDEEVVPPATADDPAVRDAWLARIRELVRNGDTDAARESLRTFRARYPKYVLPDDLRPLEK